MGRLIGALLGVGVGLAGCGGADVTTTGANASANVATAGIVVLREYAFLLDRPDGSPVHWRSCEEHRYAINPAAAPPGSEPAIHEAFRQMAAATGQRWSFEGYTTSTTHDGQPHVIVVFQPPPSGAPASAQPVAVGGWYVAGLIRLDPAYASRLPLVLHEVGHIAGLDHVDASDTIMANAARTSYAPGDKAGLRLLGGCSRAP